MSTKAGQLQLAAKCVEQEYPRAVDTKGQRQDLDDRCVVARPAGIGPITACHQRRHADLHHCTVRRVEARLRADRLGLRVGDAALRRVEQLPNLLGVDRVLLKLPGL